MQIGYIYKYTNINNGKVYIGQTTKTVRHRDSLHKHSKANNYFDNSLQKHPNDFTLETIATLHCKNKKELLDLLNKLEQEYIKEYDCVYPNGYNLTYGGKNFEASEATRAKLRIASTGRHLSEEAKLKLSMLNRGKRYSEETKRKKSEKQSGVNNPFYGKHHTEETKRKLSEKAKARMALYGNPMQGKKSWNHGMRTPDDVRKKISEANKGNKSLLGRHWCNNGVINKTYIDEIPDGFVAGKLWRRQAV